MRTAKTTHVFLISENTHVFSISENTHVFSISENTHAQYIQMSLNHNIHLMITLYHDTTLCDKV
jgi:hypothetical protein